MDAIRNVIALRLKTIFIIVLFAGVFSAGAALGQTDDVSVSCYVGTADDYGDIGTIAVFDPLRRAVGLCNAAYVDCYGKCWACWADSSGSEVCKDLTGRQFTR
ncbi:MAG: hypothetical protein ACYDHW_11985 [Syntrophorhabdaceae bacterium]